MGNHKYGEARCENEYLVNAIKKERQKRKKIGRIEQGISLLVWLRAVWFLHLPVTNAEESGQIPREFCRCWSSAEPMLSKLHWNTYTSDNVKTSAPLTFVTTPNAQWSLFNLCFILVCVRPWTNEQTDFDGQRVYNNSNLKTHFEVSHRPRTTRDIVYTDIFVVRLANVILLTVLILLLSQLQTMMQYELSIFVTRMTWRVKVFCYAVLY